MSKSHFSLCGQIDWSTNSFSVYKHTVCMRAGFRWIWHCNTCIFIYLYFKFPGIFLTVVILMQHYFALSHILLTLSLGQDYSIETHIYSDFLKSFIIIVFRTKWYILKFNSIIKKKKLRKSCIKLILHSSLALWSQYSNCDPWLLLLKVVILPLNLYYCCTHYMLHQALD